jgi:hypothetical protein
MIEKKTWKAYRNLWVRSKACLYRIEHECAVSWAPGHCEVPCSYEVRSARLTLASGTWRLARNGYRLSDLAVRVRSDLQNYTKLHREFKKVRDSPTLALADLKREAAARMIAGTGIIGPT